MPVTSQGHSFPGEPSAELWKGNCGDLTGPHLQKRVLRRRVSIACACIFLALKVRLVPVSFEDPEFKSSLSQSFSLYVKYQMAIHQDPPEECGKTEVPLLHVSYVMGVGVKK